MEKSETQVNAETGKEEIIITRTFDLPVELLYRAYTESAIIEQWMGTKVLKLENKKHGSYLFETTDPKGNKYRFTGVIHDIVPNRKIIRTFEFEKMSLGVQLELLEFEKLTDKNCKINIHSIYESVALRDRQLQMPFAQGLNMAHNRLEDVISKLKWHNKKQNESQD